MSHNHHLHPAERLKRIRETIGLSQRELAKEFQVTPGAIAAWELGTRPIPGPILKLLEIYEQSLPNVTSNSQTMGLRDLKWSLPSDLKDENLFKQIEEGLDSFLVETARTNKILAKIKATIFEQLIKSLQKSKGVTVKAAQLASYLEMGLSQETRSALGTLQSSSKATDFKKITAVLTAEYQRPLAEIFKTINPTPLAVTSLGQVHYGRLVNNEEVAIKIKHPDIEKILNSQFQKIQFFQRLGSFFKENSDDIVSEIKRAVLAECDYLREAHNQSKFKNIVLDEPHIIVPHVHMELTTENILVSEFIKGESFQSFSIKATQQMKNEAAEAIVKALGKAAFHHCLTHGDLHPGNFLFVNNKVVILDFGRMHEADETRMKSEVEFYLALLHRNKQKAEDLAKKIGFAKDPDNFDFDEFWSFLINSNTHLLTNEKFKFNREYVQYLAKEGRHFSGKKKLKISPDSFWGFVFSAGTWAIYADLEAECNWRKIAIETISGEK